METTNTNQFLLKMGFGPVVPIFPTKSRMTVRGCVLKIEDISGQKPSCLGQIIRSESLGYQAALQIYNELERTGFRTSHPHPGSAVISLN